MKKNKLLILVPSLFLLFSCTGKLSIHSVSEIRDYVSGFTPVSHETYDYQIKGNYLGVVADTTSFNNALTSEPYYDDDSTTVYTSAMLGVPFDIADDDFYLENDKGNVVSSCDYYRIRTTCINSAGSITKLETEFLSDGGIKFFSRNSDLTLTFKGLYAYSVSVNARFNVSLTYGSDGYLIEEKVTTSNIGKQEANKTISLTCTYSYE